MKNILQYKTLVLSLSADGSSELTASKKKIEELEELCASQDLEVSTDCVYSFMLLEDMNKSAREVPHILACGSRNTPPTQHEGC